MQLVPRYLVSNRSVVVANEAGIITEYRPVYQKHIQVYKGIDNVLEFKIINADQKPIDLRDYTIKFMAFDENNRLVIERDGVSLQTEDSSTFINKGLAKVTVLQNDTLNLKQQYLKYTLHLVDEDSNAVITYTDTHFGMNGTIYLSSEAFPGPASTLEINGPIQQIDDTTWTLGYKNAQPGINGNEALHTVAVYSSSYEGDVSIQTTLENQVTNQTNWVTISTLSFTGSETMPVSVNFNGVYSYIRVVATSDPSDKITKILLRN
jgi:hypothetical protein